MTGPSNLKFRTFDGLTLAASLYSGGDKKPCVIMTSGFSGLKDHFLPDWAERFVAEGFTVLIYDNRCWGESGGSPRNHVDPILQSRDYLDAFQFATTLPEVDPTRIIFWGSSMSGGNVINAAAMEPRVFAVISQVPFVSGGLVARQLGQQLPQFLDERGSAAQGQPSMLVPVFPDNMEEATSGQSMALLRDPASLPFITEMERRGYRREKTATLASVTTLLLNEPQAVIHRIAPRPLLMVVATDDMTCSTPDQMAMFEKAGEPKTLKQLHGADHFTPYYGPFFEENVKAQVDFLKKLVG